MSSRGWTSMLLGAVLLWAAPSARAQSAVDPLTGATPDASAALGAKPYEAIYFDAKGNVTDDSSKAVKYAVTDNVQGMTSMPKPINQMTPQEREKLGLASPPSEKPAEALKSGGENNPAPEKPAAEKPADKPAENPAAEPAGAAKTPAEEASKDSGIVKGTEVKDPDTGLVYGDVKPELVKAAKDSYAPPAGGSEKPAPPDSVPAEGPAPAHAFVAPAVASQLHAMEAGGAAPRGYRALDSLVGLRDSLIQRIQSFFGDGAEARLSGYGVAYDGGASKTSPALRTRASDERFGVRQTTTE